MTTSVSEEFYNATYQYLEQMVVARLAEKLNETYEGLDITDKILMHYVLDCPKPKSPALRKIAKNPCTAVLGKTSSRPGETCGAESVENTDKCKLHSKPAAPIVARLSPKPAALPVLKPKGLIPKAIPKPVVLPVPKNSTGKEEVAITDDHDEDDHREDDDDEDDHYEEEPVAIGSDHDSNVGTSGSSSSSEVPPKTPAASIPKPVIPVPIKLAAKPALNRTVLPSRLLNNTP